MEFLTSPQRRLPFRPTLVQIQYGPKWALVSSVTVVLGNVTRMLMASRTRRYEDCVGVSHPNQGFTRNLRQNGAPLALLWRIARPQSLLHTHERHPTNECVQRCRNSDKHARQYLAILADINRTAANAGSSGH